MGFSFGNVRIVFELVIEVEESYKDLVKGLSSGNKGMGYRTGKLRVVNRDVERGRVIGALWG